jgi:hypothetical protein
MQRSAAQHVQISPAPEPVPLRLVQNRPFARRTDDLAVALLFSTAGMVLQLLATGILS